MMNRDVALRTAAACALVASVGCTRSTDFAADVTLHLHMTFKVP